MTLNKSPSNGTKSMRKQDFIRLCILLLEQMDLIHVIRRVTSSQRISTPPHNKTKRLHELQCCICVLFLRSHKCRLALQLLIHGFGALVHLV